MTIAPTRRTVLAGAAAPLRWPEYRHCEMASRGTGRRQGDAARHQGRAAGQQGPRQSVQPGDVGRPLLCGRLRIWRDPSADRCRPRSARGAQHPHHPQSFRSHAGARTAGLQRLGRRAARADRRVGTACSIGGIVARFLDSLAYDIDIRMADEGRPDLRKLVRVHEFEAPSAGAGMVFARDGLQVSAAKVRHPPITHAYAYRFDTPDRSIVLSGDTTYAPELIALAKGADVLVHEVMHLEGLDRLLGRNPNAPTLRKHLLDSHTTTEQLFGAGRRRGRRQGRWCSPTSCPATTPPSRTPCGSRGVAKNFSGEIVVGRDLMSRSRNPISTEATTVLHLIKLCVGCDSVKDLQDWIKEKLKARKAGVRKRERNHTTRMMPKRADEITDGGSLFWVIRGQIMCRERILEHIRPFVDKREGVGPLPYRARLQARAGRAAALPGVPGLALSRHQGRSARSRPRRARRARHAGGSAARAAGLGAVVALRDR